MARKQLKDPSSGPSTRSKGRKSVSPATSDEFPLLNRLGLYAANTTGDGNCLFRALSDQMYGKESDYAQVRHQVVQYITNHRDRFEAFVGEFGESFEQYTSRMADDAAYGGHLEIVAFAEEYGHEVAIYQAETMYIVQPTENSVKSRIHVAYHTWEHYSSVRNKSGPHSGLPEVVPTPGSGSEESTPASNENVSSVPQWKVDIVLRSVDADEDRVKKLLEHSDYAAVIETLLMEEAEDDVTSASKAMESVQPAEPAEPAEASEAPEATKAEEETVKVESSQNSENKPKRKTARDIREEKKKKALERKMANARSRKAAKRTTVPATEPSRPSDSGDKDLPVNPLYI